MLLAGELPIHAALVSNKESAASVGVEINPAFAAFKVGDGVEGSVREKIKSHGVGNRGAKGFDEVQGQGWAAVGGFVKEAEGGIESDGIQAGFSFGGKEGVGVGEDGVGRIVRRAAGAAFKGCGRGKKGAVSFKVGRGGGTFAATENVETDGTHSGLGRILEGTKSFRHGGSFAVGSEALEDAAAVEYFGFDE